MNFYPFIVWEYRSARSSWVEVLSGMGLFCLLYSLSTFAFPITTDPTNALRMAFLSAILVEIYEGSSTWYSKNKPGFFDQICLMGEKALLFCTLSKLIVFFLLSVVPKTVLFFLFSKNLESWLYGPLFLTATTAAGILGQHVGFLLSQGKKSHPLSLLILFPFLTPLVILSGLALSAPPPSSIFLGLLGILLMNSLLYGGSVLLLSTPARYDKREDL